MTGEDWVFLAIFGAMFLASIYFFLDTVRDESKSPLARVMLSIFWLACGTTMSSFLLFVHPDSPIRDGSLAVWAADVGVWGVIGYAIGAIGGLGAVFGIFAAMGSAPMGYKDGSGPEPSLGPATLLIVSGGVVFLCGGLIANATYWAIPIAVIAAVVSIVALFAIFSD